MSMYSILEPASVLCFISLTFGVIFQLWILLLRVGWKHHFVTYKATTSSHLT